MTHTRLPVRLFLVGLIFMVSSLLLLNCNRNKNQKIDTERIPDSLKSVNILFPEKLSKSEIQQLFAGIPGFPADALHIRTCPCDTGLTNITLPKNWIIKGHEGGLAIKNTTSDAEGQVALPGSLVGLNHPTSTFEKGELLDVAAFHLDTTLKQLALNATTTIKIAVFDSGLSNGFIPADFSSAVTHLCRGSDGRLDLAQKSTTGWNFVTDRTDPTDTKHINTDKVMHGSRVSYMLAKQFLGSKIAPHIIPMRILGKDNQGDLFSLLCAMETARKNDVKVFNMSLGYYGPEDALLKKYLQRAIEHNIWIVTAAGNQLNSSSAADRDLATMASKFYPAYFSQSRGFDKLLVATTVLIQPTNMLVASTRQNFDKKLVLGILADTSRMDTLGTGLEGRFFLDAPKNKRLLIFGSSYATPVLTGRLALLLADHPATGISGLLNEMVVVANGNQVKQNRYFPGHH